jgi:hypothetical protein
MHRQGAFAHTVRPFESTTGRLVKREGDSLRYTAMVALGLSCLDEETQRQVLDGKSAAELAYLSATRAKVSDDIGAMALAAWALAEAGESYSAHLFDRLNELFASGAAVATVHCAWTLIAALAARHVGDTRELTEMAARRLIGAQTVTGLFPHIEGGAGGRMRSHVGCFADQVYSVQGLARLHIAHTDHAALAAAEACASRICDLQGSEGQWWWHYDIRDASVVEGYPVYSVHQYAMGPMALLDLWEAGGRPHWHAIVKGLGWLDHHPEVGAPLICDKESVIWRKVARREPHKAVRAISAVTTALKSGFHLPLLDTFFPPNQVDYECRPYELGWLLYAWLS